MSDKRRRRALTSSQRYRVFKKTDGRCHVCGCRLRLHGKWWADHVLAVYRGGACAEDNYLPACITCNRLRWGYDCRTIRFILRTGIYMRSEVLNKTTLGKQVSKKVAARLRTTRARGL